MAKVFAIASGKGGTGKTMTVVNLGTALALLGKQTVVLDADIGMANLGLVLGLERNKVTLHEVLSGKADIWEAIYEMPSGLKVVPSGISIKGFEKSDPDKLQFIMRELIKGMDFVLIDAPAGINKDGVIPLAIADEVLLVVNPELSSMLDAAKVEVVTNIVGGALGGVIINRVSPEKAALSAKRIGDAMNSKVIGVIPEDSNVRKATTFQMPVVLKYPDSPASIGIKKLASDISGSKFTIEEKEKSRGSFVDRLAQSVFEGI